MRDLRIDRVLFVLMAAAGLFHGGLSYADHTVTDVLLKAGQQYLITPAQVPPGQAIRVSCEQSAPVYYQPQVKCTIKRHMDKNGIFPYFTIAQLTIGSTGMVSSGLASYYSLEDAKGEFKALKKKGLCPDDSALFCTIERRTDKSGIFSFYAVVSRVDVPGTGLKSADIVLANSLDDATAEFDSLRKLGVCTTTPPAVPYYPGASGSTPPGTTQPTQ